MLNILIGACTAIIHTIVGFFTFLYFLAALPNLYVSVQKKGKNDPFDILIGFCFIFISSGIIFLVSWLNYEQEWALYGLYTIAILAGTNLLSGFYEVGRWKRNKKAQEAQNKQEKVVEAAKEAPVSMDSFGSLYTEVDALPTVVSEKKAEKLLAKISAAHAGGELTPTEFKALTRMVLIYRRFFSA